MLVKVYRLETHNGHGPFMQGAIYKYVTRDMHTIQTGFPPPQYDDVDFHPWDDANMQCGCANLRWLLRWFPAKVIRNMRECDGYGIAVYKIEMRHVKYGNSQVVFDKSHAERIEFK